MTQIRQQQVKYQKVIVWIENVSDFLKSAANGASSMQEAWGEHEMDKNFEKHFLLIYYMKENINIQQKEQF